LFSFFGFQTFPEEDTAIIVEGKIEKITLDEVRLPNSVSVPNGVGSNVFLDNHEDYHQHVWCTPKYYKYLSPSNLQLTIKKLFPSYKLGGP